jgi:hypothetical protein
MTAKRTATKKAPVAKKVEEIIIEVPDTVGAMAEVLEQLAEKKINLLAYTALRLSSVGVVHIVPDSASKASRVLEKAGSTIISTSDIVFAAASDKVGAGAALARKIADAGVNIHYSYATAAGARKFGVIYQTEDNAKTIRALNK